jgi:hypothetical protein
MATYNIGPFITRLAGADLSASNFRILVQQADRTVVLANAATQNFIGVLHYGAKQGGEVSILGRNAGGTFKVIAGGTIAVGDALTSDANGAAITTTTAGNEVIGFAQEAAVAGQVIEYQPAFRKY